MTTDLEIQTNFREDGMECQSFGSNYHLSSQSRKVSIGILVDPIARSKVTDIREQEAKKLTPNSRNCMEHGIKGAGCTSVSEKGLMVPEQDISPWISVRSSNKKIPTSVTDQDAEGTPSFSFRSKRHNGPKGLKEASAVHSIRFFVSKTKALEYDEDNEKNFCKATHMRKAKKIDNAENVDDLAFSTEPEGLPDKGMAEGKTNESETEGTEILRMKIWEILGNVSSPNKESPGFLPVNTDTKDLHPDHESDRRDNPAGKPKQTSDTIESDSERLDEGVTKRPATCSLTQNKAPTKIHLKKSRTSTLTSYRKESADKSVFSFGGEFSGKLYEAVSGRSLPSKRQRSERNSFGVDADQMSFCACKNPEGWQSENKEKSAPVVEKSKSAGNNITTNNISCGNRTNVYVKAISENKKRIADESSHIIMTENVEISKMKDQQQDLAYSMLTKIMDPLICPQSPTFEIKVPKQSSSLSSPPKSNLGKHHDQSPADRICTTKGIKSIKSLFHSKSNQHISNTKQESSGDSGELKDSPIMKAKMSLEDMEERMSNPSIDEMGSDSSSHIKGCKESKLLSPEIGSTKRQEIVSCQSKWQCNQEGVELTEFSPMSNSFKETEVSYKLQGHLEQYQEDGLVSAIALVAKALDHIKTKMKSATSKKTTEILRSTAEGIYLQLQGAESQIKTDVGKLTTLSKLKRKSLETRFEEQREQLQNIYKKFKAEIDRHLVEYKSLIEDLEEQKIELKGTMEKQRTAHNRHLLQGKQAVDIQFKDAQRRITAVHDCAKEKMLQLKHAIAECVKEGAFS